MDPAKPMEPIGSISLGEGGKTKHGSQEEGREEARSQEESLEEEVSHFSSKIVL
jgi:hypothetical protein